MKGILYACHNKKEYVVIDVDLEKGTFTGYFEDITGIKFFIVNRKIADYDLYDSSTKIGKEFDVVGYLNS